MAVNMYKHGRDKDFAR